jgi:hypothetical protein
MFPKGHWVLNYCAYPFSMTHILICLIGGMLRFLNWDPNLTLCQTFEGALFVSWLLYLWFQWFCVFVFGFGFGLYLGLVSVSVWFRFRFWLWFWK